MRMSSAATSVRSVRSAPPGDLRSDPTRPERGAADRNAAIDHIQVAAPTRSERVLQSASIGQMRDERPGILGEIESLGPRRAHNLEPPIRPVVDRVLALLDLLEAADARQNPELDEPHRFACRAVLLRVQIAPVGERHHLGRAGLESAVVAERVGMQEVARHDVRQRLDVLVRVERPLRSPDDPVVVEHTECSDPICSGSR